MYSFVKNFMPKMHFFLISGTKLRIFFYICIRFRKQNF